MNPYLLFIVVNIASPIIPRNNPPTDAPQLKKLRKNVDGTIFSTIKKGRIQPNRSRIRPKVRRKRGDFILIDKASRPPNDPVRGQITYPSAAA